MKAFRVVYRNGHFIDQEARKRIIPIQGSIYTITGKDDAFAEEDERLQKAENKTEQEKWEWAAKEFGGKENIIKLLPAETVLYFEFGNARKLESDEKIKFKFSCILLEDLFLFKIARKPEESPKSWRMVPCNCQLLGCENSSIIFSEAIKAASLNMLFSHTVNFYFNLQRSGSVNVFDYFYINIGKKSQSYRAADEKDFLRNIRERRVINRNENKA
jgi:hypothetical protein